MILYIIVVLFIIINTLTKKQIFLFVPLILILLSCLRNATVGIDNMEYKLTFLYQLPNLDLRIALLKYEPGWLLLNKIVYNLSGNYQYIILISSIITILPIYFISKKASSYPALSILLYVTLFYYFLSFSLIRQFIAISYTLLGTYYLREKKSKAAISYFLIAFLFHYSVIIVIPTIYAAKHLNFNKDYLLAILSITFILGFIDIFAPLKNIIEFIPFEKYANYFNYKSGVQINRMHTYLFLVPVNIVFYYSIKYTKQSIYSRLLLGGIILQNLFTTFPLISRLALYFTIYEILVIPELFSTNLKIQSKRILYTIISVYFVSYFTYYMLTNRGGVLPFHFL